MKNDMLIGIFLCLKSCQAFSTASVLVAWFPRPPARFFLKSEPIPAQEKYTDTPIH